MNGDITPFTENVVETVENKNGSGTMDLIRDVAKNKGMTYSELVESIYKDIFE